jgi:hypothetical protein
MAASIQSNAEGTQASNQQRIRDLERAVESLQTEMAALRSIAAMPSTTNSTQVRMVRLSGTGSRGMAGVECRLKDPTLDAGGTQRATMMSSDTVAGTTNSQRLVLDGYRRPNSSNNHGMVRLAVEHEGVLHLVPHLRMGLVGTENLTLSGNLLTCTVPGTYWIFTRSTTSPFPLDGIRQFAFTAAGQSISFATGTITATCPFIETQIGFAKE